MITHSAHSDDRSTFVIGGRFGVYDAFTKGVTRNGGYLHDDRNSLLVHGDELVESMTGFGLFNASEKILTAITTAFNTKVSSEDNPQVWMYKTEEVQALVLKVLQRIAQPYSHHIIDELFLRNPIDDCNRWLRSLLMQK